MKNLKLIFVAIIMIASYSLTAQVVITTDGSSADASAMLEVKSTTKGMLIPQVALMGVNDASTITTPATSLLIYNTATATGVTPGYYYNAGTSGAPVWTRLATGDALAIGDTYQGGIIFWLDATGQHGLIAATVDQSTGIQWYNGTDRYTGTIGDGLYAGSMNTALIVATQTADNPAGNFAAKVCADYSVTVGGVTYGYWYLPSNYELNLLYLQKGVVGGFASNYYWSSTEGNDHFASTHNFANGSPYDKDKSNTYYVRAVRAF